MNNKLLIGTMLVAAIGIAGCGKAPPGETSHTPTNSERAQQVEQQPTEPQQHSGQSSNSGQATSGQSEQASKPSQAPAGGTEQQTQSGQAAPEQTGQPSTPTQGTSGHSDEALKPGEAEPGGAHQNQASQATPEQTGQTGTSTQAKSGQSDEVSKANPPAPGGTEQQAESNQGPSDQETRSSQGQEGEPSRQQEANADENRKSDNSLGQSSQQNPAVGQSQGGTAGQTGTPPIQPPQNQQSTDNAPLTIENGKAGSGPVATSPNEIRQVQVALKARGFDPGNVDGMLGPRTRNALISFQRRQRLDPTGKIDGPTMAALDISNQAGSTTSDQAQETGTPVGTAGGGVLTGPAVSSAAGVAATQKVPDARMQAPIGHRQPRPSDLPPSVQHEEQLNPSSAETQPAKTQPQNQTANRRARAGSVPTIDIRKGCEAAEKDLADILGPNNGITAGSCLKQEQDARQTMVNNWTKYPAGDKQKCIDTKGYLPSYVEWLTCLEMYRDVKSVESEPQGQATSGRGSPPVLGSPPLNGGPRGSGSLRMGGHR